jgi:hypothetical protein
MEFIETDLERHLANTQIGLEPASFRFFANFFRLTFRVKTETLQKRPIPLRKSASHLLGSPGRIRTSDRVVNSHLLYRLSYRGSERYL